MSIANTTRMLSNHRLADCVEGMSALGRNRPKEDVRIHDSFRRENGHAREIAGRPNLTQLRHWWLKIAVALQSVTLAADPMQMHRAIRSAFG